MRNVVGAGSVGMNISRDVVSLCDWCSVSAHEGKMTWGTRREVVDGALERKQGILGEGTIGGSLIEDMA